MINYDPIRNNIEKMLNKNRDHSRAEIARLGSFEQRETNYRRNGMLNFGAMQMVGIVDLSYYVIGQGGPTIVGS